MNERTHSYLVVDDDNAFRSRLAKAFRDRQLETFEAADASSTLIALDAHKISRAIVDLRIDQDSGLDLVPAMLKKTPSLEVIILTGYGSIATAVDALRLGAVNYMTKPCNPDQLLAAFQSNSSSPKPLHSVPTLSQVEWEHIQRVLSDNGGNVSKTAKSLKLHRRSLQRKLLRPPGPLK